MLLWDVREQADYFLVVHNAKDSAFGDFETVDVEDRKNGTWFGRIDILVTVPCSGSGTCFGLSIAYDAAYNEIRVVHDGAKGYAEGVPEFTAFVDCARSLGIDVAGSRVSGEGREGEEWNLGNPPGTLKRVMSFWRPLRSRVYSGKNLLRESSSQRQERMAGAPWPDKILDWTWGDAWQRTGTDDQECVEISVGDDPVKVCIDQNKTGAGTPVAKETRLDVVMGEALLEENIVLEKNHRWGDFMRTWVCRVSICAPAAM
jgi:hypothetical protein